MSFRRRVFPGIINDNQTPQQALKYTGLGETKCLTNLQTSNEYIKLSS